MAFGIYKQGQGYWVRTLTAGFAGVIIIAAAAWGWGQAGVIRLPAKHWTLALSSVHGEIAPGDTVTLDYYDTTSDTPETLTELGSATVEQYTPGKGATGTLVLSGFDDTNAKLRIQANESQRARIGAGDSATMTAQIRGSTPTPIFPVEYLQAGTAGLFMLLGAILLYIFVGTKKQTVEFLVATDGEMKKVNWTSYREVKGSTIVVIAATFLIAGFLFGVDTLFARIFSAIGVLQK